MPSPRNICSPELSGKEGGGGWRRFGAEDRIAGAFFFGACSADGGIHVQAACPEWGEGGRAPAGQFFEGRNGNRAERLRHKRF